MQSRYQPVPRISRRCFAMGQAFQGNGLRSGSRNARGLSLHEESAFRGESGFPMLFFRVITVSAVRMCVKQDIQFAFVGVRDFAVVHKSELPGTNHPVII